MKKKLLLLFLPLFFTCLFFMTSSKDVQAIVPYGYYYVQPATYPYRADQTTSYANRFLWSGNKIYTKIDYTTWVPPGKAGTSWYQAAHYDPVTGEYVEAITRKFYGYDNFWCYNTSTKEIIAQWSSSRAAMVSGQAAPNNIYPMSLYPATVYRKETTQATTTSSHGVTSDGWIPIGGAIPNAPSGHYVRDDAQKKYFLNVSGTSANLASYKSDFSWANGTQTQYVPTGAGVSAQVTDYVVGFQYIINQSPATEVTLANSTYDADGNIDVTSQFTSGQTWYIHIKTRSYTNLLSARVDIPIADASLRKTLTLTGDVGIQSLTGAGSYYPYQTVTINATPKDGYLFDHWTNNGNGVQTTTNPQTFVMPSANQSYTATSKKIQRNVSVSLFIEDRDGVSTKTTDSNLATFSFNGFSDLVYLNQAYDWDMPFTLNATVKDPVNYRIKRIDMGTPPIAIVNGATNNVGTSRTPQEINIYIEKLVGNLTNPTIIVNNPSAPGVYHDMVQNLYYLKADDTPINLLGTCVLNPINYSRIDKTTLTNFYGNYQLAIPRADITSGSFTKETIKKTETFSKDFFGSSTIYPSGEPTIVAYDESTLQFTQNFIATDEEKRTFTIKSYASSIEDTDDSHKITATGNTLAIQGDYTRPSTSLVIKDLLRDSIVPTGFLATNWTNAETLTFQLSDLGSGIKSYVLSKDGATVSSNFYDTRTTKESFTIDTIEGKNVYHLTVEDNVGNITSYDFTLSVDKTKPSITDTDTAFGASNVKATNGPWNVTNVDATWDYNWTKEKLLSYLAEDVSGVRNLDIYNYGTDETYTTIQGQQNIIKNATTASALKSIPFENTTGILNGKSYLKLVVEDLAGNKTTVNIVVRTDNRMSTIQYFQASGPNLNRPISEINEMFESGTIGMNTFSSGIQININEKFSTDDTSGIQKVEVLCKDPTTGAVLKTYDVTSRIYDAVKTKESTSGTSLFTPLIRNLSGAYSFGINTTIDLPTYSTLDISVQTTDYAGNVATSEDQTIANYAIKAVIYSTKEKAYNLPVNDGKSNVAYFKTGEVGYIEVWTVGYVDKLELDFSNQEVGQVANTAIANKQLLPKYILGVKNAGMANTRYVTTVKDFKVTSSIPDVNGVPFLSHIKYTPDEVNQSVGDFGINGWAEKGTMIRIPPSLILTPKTKMIDGKEVGIKDKDGNQLYHWKNCIASVYAFKNNVEGPIPSSCQYTIWDESGDDIHYRVIHQMIKK